MAQTNRVRIETNLVYFFQILANKMWVISTPHHQQMVTSMIGQLSKDLVLVGKCGGRVACHSLLLALSSPMMADMLAEVGEKTSISLPFPLPSLSALACVLQGRQVGERVPCLEEAAASLGISLKPGELVKMEVPSGEEDYGNDWEAKEEEFVKEEPPEKKMAPIKKTKPRPKKRKPIESSSDESSDDDTNDPDFWDTKKAVGLRESNGHASPNSRGRGRGRPRKEAGTFRQKKSVDYEFGCDQCETRFQSHYCLIRHRLAKHDVPMVCDDCGEKFILLKDYKKHRSENHPSYKCSFCGENKFTKSSLDNHVESQHLEDVPCPHCGMTFATKASLNLHIDRIHNDNEPVKCTMCDYKTNVPMEMRQHFKRRHTEETLKNCEFCGEIFKDLKNHLRRTNCGGPSERKKVPCVHCAKEFSSGDKMREHVKRIHEGVKDKFCSQCSYATYSNFNLKLHITKMHLGTGLVKQGCPYCDKETTNLDYHIQTYHSERYSPQKLI